MAGIGKLILWPDIWISRWQISPSRAFRIYLERGGNRNKRPEANQNGTICCFYYELINNILRVFLAFTCKLRTGNEVCLPVSI